MYSIRPVIIDDTVLISSTLAEDDYAEYSSGTTYAVGNRCIVADEHKIYESLKDANTGNNPPDNLIDPDDPESDPWWKFVSYTNRWKMFDGTTGSLSTTTDEIEIELSIETLIDAIAMYGLTATSARIVVDAYGNNVHDETHSLLVTAGITDYYEWFFEPVEFVESMADLEIPAWENVSVTITLSNPGGVVSCGQVVVGKKKWLGSDQFGATPGMTSYSKKTADDYGVYTLEAGEVYKTVETSLFMPTSHVDSITRFLNEYESTPLAFVGDGGFSSLNVFGFVGSYSPPIISPNGMFLQLSIEGL